MSEAAVALRNEICSVLREFVEICLVVHGPIKYRDSPDLALVKRWQTASRRVMEFTPKIPKIVEREVTYAILYIHEPAAMCIVVAEDIIKFIRSYVAVTPSDTALRLIEGVRRNIREVLELFIDAYNVTPSEDRPVRIKALIASMAELLPLSEVLQRVDSSSYAAFIKPLSVITMALLAKTQKRMDFLQMTEMHSAFLRMMQTN